MPQASTINSSVIYVETQTATSPPPPPNSRLKDVVNNYNQIYLIRETIDKYNLKKTQSVHRINK